MSNFIQLCLSGDALVDEVDDFVDRWHAGEGADKSLAAFLGMEDSEYEQWMSDPNMINFILAARMNDRTLSEEIEKFRHLPLAARAQGTEQTKLLIEWLRSRGYLAN